MEPEDNSHRQYLSSLTVLAVALFIGLPVWWKSTEVYRCPLPYSEIMELRSHPVPPEIAVTVSIALLGSGDLAGYVEHLQQHLVEGSVSARNVRIRTKYVVKSLSLDPSLQSQLLSALHSSSLEDMWRKMDRLLPSVLGHYSLLVVGSELVRNGPLPENASVQSFVSYSRHSVIVYNQDLADSLSAALKLIRGVYGDRRQLEKALKRTAGLQQERVDMESMRQLRASQGYQISFTLIDPTPSERTTSWNIEEATDSVLLPFLAHSGIASLGTFTISSQVFYFTDIKFRAHKSETGHHILTSQLPPMISTIESKLGSLVSQQPSLNFLVYVPKHSETPLTIRSTSGEHTDTFLVPQWGGVVFYNPNVTSDLVDVRMEKVMHVFVEQLKSLLGIPSDLTVPSGATPTHFSSSSLGVTDWQVDHLLTAMMVESISMATTSLISLVGLLDKVKNMVISDQIEKQVMASLQAIQRCYQLAAEGDLDMAYTLSKRAMDSAETAFFDPSILELLYFPDDQKFAIYIPLFLPISVPILFSSIAALKWLRTALRTGDRNKLKSD